MNIILFITVALRKESVDRNADKDADWVRVYVALRKESVDRNRSSIKRAIARIKSLSARRAWIEIASRRRVSGRALCRSPQGERG